MGITFLKGAASHQAVDKVEAEQEAKKNTDFSYTTRFWIPENGTFLDGDLDGNGMLDELTYWEHQVKMGGDWRNWYPCIQGEEKCPICEDGEYKSSLVAIFTIIDHSEWVSKKGKSKGKTFKDQKKLFVCKKGVLKRLRQLATKRGGLAGVTFDVSRLGDTSENVGDTFDFTKKWEDMSEFAGAYNLNAEDVYPHDYTDIVPDFSRADLIKLGFGSNSSGGPAAGSEPAAVGSYDKEL